MDFRVILLFFAVAVCDGTLNLSPYYKTEIGREQGVNSGGFAGQPPEWKVSGFPGKREPNGGSDEDGRAAVESIAGEGRTPLPGAKPESEGEPHGFVQPVHFISTYNSDGSEGNAEKIWKYLNPEPMEPSRDQASKATREFEETLPYAEPDETPRTLRHSPKSSKRRQQQRPNQTGYKRRSEPSAVEYYTDLYSKEKDVEMILPRDRSIILPMVNGKPKPYDGYRAASDVRARESDRRTKSRRYSRPDEVVYGRPKKGVESILPYRIKRAPAAEYHGGIYPHFDYSDPENARKLFRDPKGDATDGNNHPKRRKGYPKKYAVERRGKPYDSIKYPKGNRKVDRRVSDESETGEAEEEEMEEESQEQNNDDQIPPYKYEYDDTFVIPELRIKYYPHERQRGRPGDNTEEGTEEEEAYESPVDEYTAGYERYKKSLPTDLEKYFSRPAFTEYSAEATENLEKNENCQKVVKELKRKEGNGTEQADAIASEGAEICYVCTDPKTGGSYEQCAYKIEPKSKRYFRGGSTFSRTDESPEPVTYRYKRSAAGDGYDFSNDSEMKRRVREIVESGHLGRPSRDMKRKKQRKQWGLESDNDDRKYPSFTSLTYPDHYESSSSRRNKKARNRESLAEDYEGPRFTYEGPEFSYEGPAQTYEGPIHKDYYITSDDRIEDDEDGQSNEETQRRPKKKNYRDSNSYHPDRRSGSGFRRSKHAKEPRNEAEDLDDHHYYTPSYGYTSDYRFGPEHFVDDDAKERPKEESRQEERAKPSGNRHKGSESRPAAQTNPEDRESGTVQVFKNGDVCRKKKVDGMICMVCKNEKTAATYEQCQYSSKPKDKYYAFGSQKSYRTTDPNADRRERNSDDDQQPEKSDVIEKKILITKQKKVFEDASGPLDSLPSKRVVNGDLLTAPSHHLETKSKEKDGNDTDDGRVTVSRMEPRDTIEGLDEYLHSNDDDDDDGKESDEDKGFLSYEEYFRDVFPEYSNKKEYPYSEESSESDEEEDSEESHAFDPFSHLRKFKKDTPAYLDDGSEEEDDPPRSEAEASNEEPVRLKDKKSRITPDFFEGEGDDYHKKDIEKALGEFQSRDWSKCKKVVRDKLTCYQCVDENGVNNEECMYVEASKPMKQQLAYREKKELEPVTIGPQGENATATEEAATEGSTVKRRRLRRPKNSKEAITEETTQAAREFGRRRLGDFRGVTTPPEEDVMTPVPSLTTEQVIERATESSAALEKLNHMRDKTLKNTMAATLARYQKRKFPIKKFADRGRNSTANAFANGNPERVEIYKVTNATTDSN